MEIKDILLQLRKKHQLTQSEMAEKLMITRQAVSRWETGASIPNTETLKLISKEFNISINTLINDDHPLICQCCGMPLKDDILGKDKQGITNPQYCQWCLVDGNFIYTNIQELVDFLVIQTGLKEEQLQAMLLKLNYWQQS